MSKQNCRWTFVVLIACTLAFASVAQAQTTWYVDDDASPGGDGTSWTTPFNDLQDALDVAAGTDEVHVAGGTYVPSELTVPGDSRSATFLLVNSVSLYGRYAGLADPGNPDVRDFDLYVSILSGDLAGNDGPDFANNDENSYHVVNADGAGATALLDGFTITAGNANAAEYPYRDGGGMIVDNGASPAIVNCVFAANAAYMGGGLFNYYTDPTVTDCSFEGNAAEWGGGVNNSTADAVFSNCSFDGNSSIGDGGGVRNVGGGSSMYIDCMFSNNFAEVSGGGMINVEECNPTLVGCTFSGNIGGGAGGGMHNTISSNPILINCMFEGNATDTYGGGMLNREASCPTITNCTFIENTALANGGAMANRQGSTPTITNCTFSGNTAVAGGAMLCANSVPTLANCVLWDDMPEEIYVASGGSPVITYSDVQGGWTGAGNIDADPVFDADYRLSGDSPCIDAGDNFAVPPDVADLDDDQDTAERTPLDLDWKSRFVDYIFTDDTGVPDPPNYPEVVDMGAYELQFCMGDLNGDGRVDLADLAELLGHYGETSGMTYEDGDLDGDGDVDLADLAELLGHYGDICW